MNAQTKVEASLASAMAAAFAKIEGATKGATGQVGQQKYKYANIEAVIGAIKPALINHGLFFTQHPEPSDRGVTIETWLHHASGDSLSLGKLYVPANKQDAQGFGSALTYARRYALVTAFGVPVEDDDGNAAARGQGQQGTVSPAAASYPDAEPISDADWAKIVNLCKATSTTGGEVKKHIGAQNLKVLTAEQLKSAIDFLEGKLADAAKSETNAKAKEAA